MSNLPPTNECPYCHCSMRVSECACDACEVAIRGDFPAIPLGNLPTEHQRFIEMFVLASGNLKEIATHAGVSYPTVRSRLDKVIAVLAAEIQAQQGGARGGRKKAGTGKSGGKGAAAIPHDSPSAAEIIKRI